MPYQLKNGNLFVEARSNAILTHACNAQGRWGRGIALNFKKLYPSAYKQYQDFCGEPATKQICGRTFIANSTSPIGCMITSWHWSPHDPQETILANTLKAAIDLIEQTTEKYPGYEIHSCKINAGLFGVPWALTESAIKKALAETGNKVDWVVWGFG